MDVDELICCSMERRLLESVESSVFGDTSTFLLHEWQVKSEGGSASLKSLPVTGSATPKTAFDFLTLCTADSVHKGIART